MNAEAVRLVPRGVYEHVGSREDGGDIRAEPEEADRPRKTRVSGARGPHRRLAALADDKQIHVPPGIERQRAPRLEQHIEPLAAIRQRADYCGLNFCPASPRHLSLADAARSLARPDAAARVAQVVLEVLAPTMRQGVA